VHAFFYIGGNDSAETAHLVRRNGARRRLGAALFTCRNDRQRLLVHRPLPRLRLGREVRRAGDDGAINEDNRSLPGVKIDVIMGRNAGWLTACSVLARLHEDDGPHLVYVPERDSRRRVRGDIERVHAQHGRCLVAGVGGRPRPRRRAAGVRGERTSRQRELSDPVRSAISSPQR